ncbi:MAG TPA: type II toxin-antitoxin system RelE/ParE family toxin [Thermoanaerobaculia bacterium]|nr:type II toxin-antitoxin system RelE/ParE family toxin [Thermoanaerobaculia bacterium]
MRYSGIGKSYGSREVGSGNLWFFLFGFEKNERANVSPRELEALKEIATDLLKLSSAELDDQVERGALQEICHEH